MVMVDSVRRQGRSGWLTACKGRKGNCRNRALVHAITLVSIAVSLVACGRAPSPPPPLTADVAGTQEVAGLAAPVRIVRDRVGIPHIYAETAEDLFFAQGFVQAQDRLFQMDLWRRAALGRVAEVLGANFAERDAMTRRVQFIGDPAADWASYAPGTQVLAAAFVRGVNAWVALARERPPEEFVLAGWLPEPWSADDLLSRTDTFTASGDAIEEVFRARLVATVGARRAAELLPQLAHALDVPRGLEPARVTSVVADAVRSVGAPPFFLGLAAPLRGTARAGPSDTDAQRGDIPIDVRTLPVPSTRYLVHLHAPGWNVIGATAPWMPGVAGGHNERVFWQMEPVDVDAQDLFVERVNPSNPQQVDERGRWVDTELTRDPMRIRGRDKPLMVNRERTPNGAIVAVDRERHLAFTVRSVAMESGAVGDLIALEIDRAVDAASVHAALARWKAPARRITYGDVDGARGADVAALVPVRRGWSGALPAPAWTGEHAWTGFRQPDTGGAESPVRLLARRFPDRGDALLRDLQRASAASNAPAAMRALVVNAVADALRDDGGPRSAVLFAHPLAITEATRRRFNIGPVRPDAPDARVFALSATATDWDRSTAMNAPGEAGSPSSVHYADLARHWKEGTAIALAFSDAAVSAAAESTLTLRPARGSVAP